MPPNPPNSLICSVFLALVAAGPCQCERLEPPVPWISNGCLLFLFCKWYSTFEVYNQNFSINMPNIAFFLNIFRIFSGPPTFESQWAPTGLSFSPCTEGRGAAKGGGYGGQNPPPPHWPKFLVIFTKTLTKQRSGAYSQHFRTLKNPSFANFWPQNPLLRPLLATPLPGGHSCEIISWVHC